MGLLSRHLFNWFVKRCTHLHLVHCQADFSTRWKAELYFVSTTGAILTVRHPCLAHTRAVAESHMFRWILPRNKKEQLNPFALLHEQRDPNNPTCIKVTKICWSLSLCYIHTTREKLRISRLSFQKIWRYSTGAGWQYCFPTIFNTH